MNFTSIFKIGNYGNSVRALLRRYKITMLLTKKKIRCGVNTSIWIINRQYKICRVADNSEVCIFGVNINLNTSLNWHKDYISGFVYPIKRFDKINLSKWFNKGIDVKFPWEVSRFYFAVSIAQHYVKTNDKTHYELFKQHVLDWLDKNPFCYGINWICTMEVAIRAINWIVAINIFNKAYKNDETFQEYLNNSLIQHARYIALFPEVKRGGHTNNHTTANYAGLLFLATSLKQHPLSKKWLKMSINGLEHCIRYQNYEDGVNFEASIPYHRLVLEMFAYSAIVAKANGLPLSNKYYQILFKMFEYTAAYLDQNGNAPQVGDNDSGRILLFHNSQEQDHSYLLDLGEHLFDYAFRSKCTKRNAAFRQWLPIIEKTRMEHLNINTRQTDSSIAFENGGAYFLKNDLFSVLIACFPQGQNGRGVHNHMDIGSFSLSILGIPFVVDAGTGVYTPDYSTREKFRSPEYHNTLFVKNGIDNAHNENPFNGFKYSTLKKAEIDCDLNCFKAIIELPGLAENGAGKICYSRSFSLKNNKLLIVEQIDSKKSIQKQINICTHPKINCNLTSENSCELNYENMKCILTVNNGSIRLKRDLYTAGYRKIDHTQWLQIISDASKIEITIALKDFEE